ncbi:MAG: DKNYY domain-containing protein, partial [Bacteroidota bacterium]
MFKLIKWIFKTMLVLTGIMSFTKCGSGYKKKDGKIYFDGKEITDKSFVVLNDAFAKDSTTAYFKNYPFQYADVATFEAVDEHYAKDKNKVYYCDEYREGQNYYLTKRQTIDELEDVHPESFVALEYGYAKDSKNAYFEGIAFKVKDVASLKSINTFFAKDDTHAYLNQKPIAGSDGKSFEITDNNYAKDATHIYYYDYTGEKNHDIGVIPCNRETFAILEYPFSKDKTSVFFAGKKIDGVDGNTFKMLGHEYSKDKNAVYIETKKLNGADASTFEVFKENDEFNDEFYYTKDHATIFFADKPLKGADVSSFKVLGKCYGTDGKQIYFKTAIVKGANPLTFKVYPH